MVSKGEVAAEVLQVSYQMILDARVAVSGDQQAVERLADNQDKVVRNLEALTAGDAISGIKPATGGLATELEGVKSVWQRFDNQLTEILAAQGSLQAQDASCPRCRNLCWNWKPCPKRWCNRW